MTMLKSYIGFPPPHAPGQKVVQALHSGVYMARSEALNYNESSPASIFQVPPDTLVLGVLAEVETVFDGAIPTLAVGISGTTTRHLNTADVDLKTAGIYGPALGLSPFRYTSITDIIATLVASTSTAGKVWLHLLYRPYVLERGLARV